MNSTVLTPRQTATVMLPATVEPAPETEMIRFIEPSGTVTDLGARFGIDAELARDLYRQMRLTRAFDREGLALQRQGELSLWLQSHGQEAAQVGSIAAVRDTDMVFPSYREHGVALARGVSPAQILSQWRGVTHSGWNPADHRLHINSLVLGTQTLHATGYAAGVALDGTDEVVMVYFGDGSTSEGDVSEAFNWAATAGLAVVFFCQNNQWAISTPPHRQMKTQLVHRAAGFGLSSWFVDGNDALAVHAVTQQAAASARAGRPAFIEAATYRMAGHSTSDDPKKYRAPEEFAEWEMKDPIDRLDAYLRSIDTAPAFFDTVEEEASALGRRVREECLSIPNPSLDSFFAHAYAEPHPQTAADAASYDKHVALLESGL